MISPQHPLTVQQQFLPCINRLSKTPSRLISASQAVAGVQRIRVINPQHPLTLSQHPLKQLNGLSKTPSRLISARQAVAALQRIRVIRPQYPLTVRQQFLLCIDRLNKTPSRLISARQAVAALQRIRVIRPQHIFNSHIKLNCFIYKPKIIGIVESAIQVTSNLFTLKQKARVILNSDSLKLRNKITSLTTSSITIIRR